MKCVLTIKIQYINTYVKNIPPPFLLSTFSSLKTGLIAYPIKLCFKFKFVGFSNLVWFILVPLEFLRNSCLPEWISHLCWGLLCGFSGQLWLRAPGRTVRSFNAWTGDGMHWGQAAVSFQEARGQVGPPNPLQIFPLPQQRLPIRLNNTGAIFSTMNNCAGNSRTLICRSHFRNPVPLFRGCADVCQVCAGY